MATAFDRYVTFESRRKCRYARAQCREGRRVSRSGSADEPDERRNARTIRNGSVPRQTVTKTIQGPESSVHRV